jgi:hypothetical protein
LPLALGEAALTGAPVVCTDVGASLRVLSDPDDFSRFSAIVAPNDARALARAQISLLALLGEWSRYAEDTEPAPILTSNPTPADVAKITRRMYEKSDQRRKLGMMTRAIVQKSFSGDRYLREHEQMLWIGKARKLMSTRDVESTEYANALVSTEISTPATEETITIPPSAIRSWRSSISSTASNTPTEYQPFSVRVPIANTQSVFSENTGSITEVGSSMQIYSPRAFHHSAWGSQPSPYELSVSNSLTQPLRSERVNTNHSPTSGLQAPGKLYTLCRGDLRPYRNSDISVVIKDGFWKSRAHRASMGGPAAERFSNKSLA